MIKKSLAIVFTSLIIGGLFFVGNANAMTYTIEGNYTQVSIPYDTSNGIGINWGDETIIINEENCGQPQYLTQIDVTVYKCEKYYDLRTGHTIEISNTENERVEIIYLNSSNIKNIINFNGFPNLNQIYLQSNPIEILNTNALNGLGKNYTIRLDSDQITTFLPSMDYIKSLYLRNNELTTIPNSIRKARGDTQIKLSNSISYGDNSKDKLADLSNNHIKFVGITNFNGTEDNIDNCHSQDYDDDCKSEWVNYNFERFGFDQDNSSPTYNYKICSGDCASTITGGNTSNTGITIEDLTLSPGYYTFQVSLLSGSNSIRNDTIYFFVEYDDEIKFTNNTAPSYNQTIDSIDNIKRFERYRNGISLNYGYKKFYPSEFIGGYKYELEKDGYFLIESSILHPETSITGDGYYYVYDEYYGNIETNSYSGYNLTDVTNITTKINELSEQNGNYTLTVYLVDTGGNYITTTTYTDCPVSNNRNTNYYICAKTQFTIDIPEVTYPTIEINRPLNTETGSSTNFSWTPHINTGGTTGFTFNSYEWIISGKNVDTIYTGILTEFSSTGFTRDDLNNGTYTFTVKMNYTYNKDGTTGQVTDSNYASYNGAKQFTVNKANSLTITFPVNNGDTLTGAENTFRRTGFTANTFLKYTYTLTGDNNYSTGGETTNMNQNHFTVRNLYDGNYTLTIIMHTDAGNETGVRNFNVNASSLKNLTITSPISGHIYSRDLEKTVSIPFTWIGTGSTLIENFSYILTNTTKNQQITGGTIAKYNSGYYQIPNIELSGGTYKFEVKMLDSDGGSIEEKSHNFSVTIPTYLTIISPIPNNNGVIEQKQNVNFSWSGFSEFDQLYKYKYELKRTKDGTTTTINSGTMNMISKTSTGFIEPSLQNGDYIFTVYMMSGSNEITHATITGKVLDTIDIALSISDGSGSWHDNNSKIIIETGNLIFNWEGQSEDLSGFYYSITGTNFKNEPFEYTGTLYGSTTGSVTLTGLISGKYRFFVNMLNGNGGSIRSGSLDFEIAIPSSLKIQYPADGSTVNSSSVTFSWTAESDILRTGFSENLRLYKYEIIKITDSGNIQISPLTETHANSFTYNFTQDGTYKLGVQLLYSGGTSVARDYSTFTISIPRSSGGGGYSSKSHPTNNLDIYIKNESPDTNEWIEVVITIDDKYTGKVDFTKMQYYSTDTEKRIDIPLTSKNYVSDYSDDAKLGYVKFSSSDDGKKELSNFIKFLKTGYYRIYVQDKDGFDDYVQFHVGLGHQSTEIVKEEIDEEEVYIARSCKRYTIRYSEALNVYTSPNLNMSEYFMNKDYFKRYIDSKNKYQDGCPKNLGWITTSYTDRTNSNNRYTAPNGKVYFITARNGDYYSEELNKELKSTPKSFKTITELKNYIKDRNPLISMAKLGPVS